MEHGGDPQLLGAFAEIGRARSDRPCWMIRFKPKNNPFGGAVPFNNLRKCTDAHILVYHKRGFWTWVKKPSFLLFSLGNMT